MISILFPTRNRPKSVQRLVDSIQNTCTLESTELVAYVDNDDKNPRIPGVIYTVGPRIVLSQCFNECAKVALGDIVMVCSDDVVFRTPGWDQIVEEEFQSLPNKIGFVHGDDGYNGSKFGTHGFVHSNWIRTLGYVLPSNFSCDYSDNWLNDVANTLGRRRYVDCLFEHMHPSVGKAEVDLTFSELRQCGARDNVAELYRSIEDKRQTDESKLRIFMER